MKETADISINITEAELVKKLVEKDEAAFRYLIDREQKNIFRLCMGFLHHREDAEDIAQEVFIEVFHSAVRFRGEARLSTWLYRIAVNKSLNYLQKRKTEKFFNSLQNFLNLRSDKEPHRLLEQKEEAAVLTQAIDRLPENQRIAYVLAKYDELSYQQIAEVMNVSVSSVESLMFRAKSNLQKNLLKKLKEK